ncbi:MAG: hypothetical protein CVV06_01175 [Gammaproteobacteria bacterium HGW-Gammaproteobacteria-10]|nr:MAG: hypothetical protein CVV06_01175 [Gammaproteobacteria bacterium HGW-Gammaproteobacteria-10]
MLPKIRLSILHNSIVGALSVALSIDKEPPEVIEILLSDSIVPSDIEKSPEQPSETDSKNETV